MASRRPTQLLSGLANAHPQAVACGKPFGFACVAYGSGAHVVVVLAEARPVVLQEILVDVDAVACVAWSADGRRLAACGHGSIVIFEAVRDESAASPLVWKLAATLHATDAVLALAWLPAQGDREMLLSAGAEVALWHTAPPPPDEKDILDDPDPDEERNYQRALESWARRLDRRYETDESWCAWHSDAPVPACFATASADGEAFATCGQFENQVKVWFRDSILGGGASGSAPADDGFQYLSHPDRVLGLAWNGGTGRNALLTSCADGLLRIWVCSRTGEAVSFYAAATWPQQPDTSGAAATWLAEPSALAPTGDAHAVVDSPLGIVPNTGPHRDWVVQFRENGGGILLWQIEGLGDNAVEASVSIVGPRDVNAVALDSCSLRAIHTAALHTAALDPYETSLSPITASLVGHGADGRLHLLETGLSAESSSMPNLSESLHTPIGTKAVSQMLVSPDGSLAASVAQDSLALWEMANPLLQFAAPRAAPLRYACDIQLEGVAGVDWLPSSAVLAVAGRAGVELYSCDGGAISKLTCTSGAGLLEDNECLAVSAFSGMSEMQWVLVGLVQAQSGAKTLAVWSVSLGGVSFEAEELAKEQLAAGGGTVMAGAASTRDLVAHGELGEILLSETLDARKGPIAVFVGDEAGAVTVYTLCSGEEEEEETEEMLIDRAVAHFPEPKRTTMKGSLLKMPAGAREKAIEKFLAMAPGGGAEPAPEPAGGGDAAVTYRLESVCTLPQEGGAVSQISVRDANRFAAVTTSEGSAELHMWTAEPASWPDFHLRRHEKKADEEIVSVAWDLASLQLVIALTDRLEVLALEADLDWTTGAEDWKLTEMLSENMQPITAVAWFHGHGLVVATEHHTAVYFDVGISASSGHIVQPDYHPDQVEMLLFGGDSGRQMLGRIARNAVSTAPEEWEPQKWRPPRTRIQELLDDGEADKDAGAGKDYDGLNSMTSLTESGPADPMDKAAARELAEKLRNKAHLLGISPDHRVHLAAILDTHAHDITGSLDASAMRFLLRASFIRRMNELSAAKKFKKEVHLKLESSDQIWAYHSETQDALLQAAFPAETALAEFLESGAPLWIRDKMQLEKVTMKVAMAEYKRRKDPDDSLLLFIAMDKRAMAIALYKAEKVDKIMAFLQNDFTQQKFKIAAKKNGFALMKKGRFEMAAAFLIIGGDVSAAITVLYKNHKNPILALLVIRLMEGDFCKNYTNCLKDHILAPAIESGDVFRASIAHWLREDYQDALGVLCQQSAPPVGDDKAEAVEFPAAVAWEVMKYISNRPVLKRAGLSNEQYTGMIRIAVGAALNYSASGQHLLGIQILKTLTEWDRYHMIKRPEVNVHFTVAIMNDLAVAAVKQLTDDAAAQVASANLGDETFQEVDFPLLAPVHLLTEAFGLETAALLSSTATAGMRELQFGLHRELQAAEDEVVASGDRWSIVESLAAASTIVALKPIDGFSPRLDALRSAVRALSDSSGDDELSPAAVKSAMMVGNFAVAWHAQDFVAMAAMLYPDLPPVGDVPWDLVTSNRTKAISYGHMLMLMLGRLGFSLEAQASGAEGGRGGDLAENARRRVWCWYSDVKSVLGWVDDAAVRARQESSEEEGSAAPEEFEGLWVAPPEAPNQMAAAVQLWSALVKDEQAAHQLGAKGCGGRVVDAMLLAESKASGDHRAQGVGDHAHDSDLTPVELFKVSKDLPFRAMCVNHASPTMIAIAASKTIMEVNIRGVLRRYGIHRWLTWFLLLISPLVSAAGNPDAENGEQGRIAKCLMTRDRKANAISSHPRDSIYATVRKLNVAPNPFSD